MKFDLKSAIERGKIKHAPTSEQKALSNKSFLPAAFIKPQTKNGEDTNPSLTQQYHNAATDYITGKINDQPKPQTFNLKPVERTQSKKFDLKTAIANNRGSVEKPGNRSILYGTGLTKKIAAKQETAAKEQTKGIAKEQLSPEEARAIQAETQSDETSIAVEHSQSLQIAAKAITLDEYQTEALKTLKNQRFGCLIGGAGMGKTTLEKQLIEEIKTTIDTGDGKLSMACVAFTGRAVQQIKRALPVEYHPLCSTIHFFLGYAPVFEEIEDEETGEWKERKVFRPTYTKQNPLPHKLIFIDESGMVPVYLFNQLIEACPHARIILIGDINQLPPVQGKSILGFAMCKWPTFELKKIHRQAADNPIIQNAWNILQGKFPVKDEKKFAILDMPDGSLKTQQKFLRYIKALHKKGLFDPFRDAIIVPKNKDNLGQLMLNDMLVAYFNPNAKREIIACGFTHKSFAVGDKVMLLQNDNERGLTNGMTGVIVNIAFNDRFDPKRAVNFSHIDPDHTEIDFTDFDKHLSFNDKDRIDEEADTSDDPNQRASSHVVTVRFPLPDGLWEEVQFATVGQMGKITHAYAFTCHKSQGGEYPTVIILCHYSDARMLTREWLYTAVTRASERVILCCNDRGLLQALHTQKIYGKTVQEKAQKFLALQGNEKIEPILPKPEIV